MTLRDPQSRRSSFFFGFSQCEEQDSIKATIHDFRGWVIFYTLFQCLNRGKIRDSEAVCEYI